MFEVTPVEVSLCTTHTALISCPVSLRKRSSMTEASTPQRQESCPDLPTTSTSRPRRLPSARHKFAN